MGHAGACKVPMPVAATGSTRRKFKPCRRQNTPGDAHALTFSCFRRQPFLTAERTRRWMIDAINGAARRYDFAVRAFVIMPEHVHILIHPRRPVFSMSLILSGIKQPVSKRAICHVRREHPEIPPAMLDVQPGGARAFHDQM